MTVQKIYAESNELFIIAENEKHSCLELILKKPTFTALEVLELCKYITRLDEEIRAVRFSVVIRENNEAVELHRENNEEANFQNNEWFTFTRDRELNEITVVLKKTIYANRDVSILVVLLTHLFQYSRWTPKPEFILNLFTKSCK